MSSDEADRDDIKMDDDDRDPIAIRSIVTGICHLKEYLNIEYHFKTCV